MMSSRIRSGVLLALLAFGSSEFACGDNVDYERDIKPVLKTRCYACHGALKQEAGLRLDTGGSIRRGGEGGAAVVAGQPDQSRLLHRVSARDDAERMPPEGEPLTAAQIQALQAWIRDGARSPASEPPEADPRKHWAFQTITRPSVPRTETDWARNPIDAFLQQGHQQRGITPQPEAPRILLLRRLSLDLIGLPPTLEEIAACEADASPDWYEKTLHRLLNDPRHGERWGRHWMDVWRYSDWWGLGDQLRNSQKHIWHWRDWIIESLNADTPYDEMVRLMLAADELHPNDLGKLRATGYLARNYWLFNRPQWMEETVEHVSKGFLGLTMNCARCHDHKYDPFEQTDYYRLRAIFEPYHVRMDLVPGETDLARNGIPRAFDGLLQEPTYLYIRGDERNLDKSRSIPPGVPTALAFDELRIAPVSLPAEAYQPGRRPWVPESHVSAARLQLTAAEQTRQQAMNRLSEARNVEAELKSQREAEQNPPLVAERFEKLDTGKWKLLGGEWTHEPGRLSQKKDGAARAALRWLGKPPQDFDASTRFTIVGGSRWRSVGLAFDVSQDDPTQPAAATDSEQNIYVSAVSDGSKIQAAYHRGGHWLYPAGSAMRLLPIKLDQPYVLRVQVRGRLINASLNGEPYVAFETPVERRPGAIAITTFDALTVVHEVTISALDPAITLRPPNAGPEWAAKPHTLQTAQAGVANAERELAVADAWLHFARADLESVTRRAAAQRAESEGSDPAQSELKAAAIQAERQQIVAKARHRVAVAEQAVHRAKSDQKEAAEKALKSEQEALEKSIASMNAEIKTSETYTKFIGAAWTPTRFFSSGKDDPEVPFPPTSSGRRTALASWMTDRRNPLTARVAVNHIWTRHMGQPLVPTMFDFGRKGTPPTHPELLDWLASELIDSGWSMKHLHRLIASSAAYRMSSSQAGGEAAAAMDAENQFYWRRQPIRMESQVVRDSLLSLAGTLDSQQGGPPVPAGMQAASTRRSLYFFHSNNERNLFLTTFDEALVKDCYRREQSIVPQQALALSNSVLALDAAERLAARLSEMSENDETFVRNAFRLVTGINPGDDELAASMRALETWRALPGGNPAGARQNLVWVLMNHNDFVTVR